MDYGPVALWISQPFGLGRIYPLAGLAVDFPALRAWAHISAAAVLWMSGLENGEMWAGDAG